jgi:hypothetical protein
MDFNKMNNNFNNQILNSMQFAATTLLTISLGGMYATFMVFDNTKSLTFGDKYFLSCFFVSMLFSALYATAIINKYLELPHLFNAEHVASNDPKIKNLKEPTEIVKALIIDRLKKVKDYFIMAVFFQIASSVFAIIMIVFV